MLNDPLLQSLIPSLKLFLAGFLTFVVVCVRYVRVNRIGIVYVLFQRTSVIARHGWHLIPFCWVKTVSLAPELQTCKPVAVVLPDASEIAYLVKVDWAVDARRVDLYFDTGGPECVKQRLEAEVRHCLLRWGTSQFEGPQIWREALQSVDLIRAFLKQELTVTQSFGMEVLQVYVDSIPYHRPSVQKLREYIEQAELIEENRKQHSPASMTDFANEYNWIMDDHDKAHMTCHDDLGRKMLAKITTERVSQLQERYLTTKWEGDYAKTQALTTHRQNQTGTEHLPDRSRPELRGGNNGTDPGRQKLADARPHSADDKTQARVIPARPTYNSTGQRPSVAHNNGVQKKG